MSIKIRRNSHSTKVAIGNQSFHVKKLFRREISDSFMDADSISTVTAYDGPAPIEFIRDRVFEVLNLNPWLNGRLVRTKGTVVLRYVTPVPVVSECFRVVKNTDRPSSGHSGKLSARGRRKTISDVYNVPDVECEQYLVKKGKDCVGKEEALFRVTILNSSANSRGGFSLVVSMSHIIGDGHTFYSIYKMLSSTAQPRALIVERDNDCLMQMMKYIEEDEKFFDSFGAMFNFVGKKLNGSITRGRNKYVSRNWVQDQKHAITAALKGSFQDSKTGDSLTPNDWSESSTPTQQFSSKTSNNFSSKSMSQAAAVGAGAGAEPVEDFVSTNDLLTSHFFTASDTDVGFMGIDFRNRIPGLTEDHAGNYEGAVAFQRGDYESPVLIRRSLRYLHRSVTDGPLLPGFFARQRARISVISNWTSFYGDVTLPGCSQRIHMPIFMEQRTPMNVAVLYMAEKDNPALMTFEENRESHPVMQMLSSRGVVYGDDIDVAIPM